MNREKLKEMYAKYELDADDVFKHQHFLIITRSGIEKIQAKEDIKITYEVIKCETNFAVVKAKTEHLQTFGSALKGATYKDGNTNSWYLMELAEKRAMSRMVLKTCNLYQLGVMGQDESEEFKRK
tara:strand:+ start:480 stop:854 length:375 start_codon:yes stop_codon:yes gene_type:complete